MHEGEFLVRWQDLPTDMIDGAVREARAVKLADLPTLLPDMSKVTPEQRKMQARERAQEYARRYLPQ